MKGAERTIAEGNAKILVHPEKMKSDNDKTPVPYDAIETPSEMKNMLCASNRKDGDERLQYLMRSIHKDSKQRPTSMRDTL